VDLDEIRATNDLHGGCSGRYAKPLKNKEVAQLKEYWGKKYPHVNLILWANDEGNRFVCKMSSASKSLDVSCETLGELISKGEEFLRGAK
jgi:hypothetical protein